MSFSSISHQLLFLLFKFYEIKKKINVFMNIMINHTYIAWLILIKQYKHRQYKQNIDTEQT